MRDTGNTPVCPPTTRPRTRLTPYRGGARRAVPESIDTSVSCEVEIRQRRRKTLNTSARHVNIRCESWCCVVWVNQWWCLPMVIDASEKAVVWCRCGWSGVEVRGARRGRSTTSRVVEALAVTCARSEMNGRISRRREEGSKEGTSYFQGRQPVHGDVTNTSWTEEGRGRASIPLLYQCGHSFRDASACGCG